MLNMQQDLKQSVIGRFWSSVAHRNWSAL